MTIYCEWTSFPESCSWKEKALCTFVYVQSPLILLFWCEIYLGGILDRTSLVWGDGVSSIYLCVQWQLVFPLVYLVLWEGRQSKVILLLYSLPPNALREVPAKASLPFCIVCPLHQGKALCMGVVYPLILWEGYQGKACHFCSLSLREVPGEGLSVICVVCPLVLWERYQEKSCLSFV